MIPEPTKEGWATLLKIIADFRGERADFRGEPRDVQIEDCQRGLRFFLLHYSAETIEDYNITVNNRFVLLGSEFYDCYLVPQGKSLIRFYTCWPLWDYFCHYSIPRLVREQEERERKRKEDRAAEMQDVVSEVKQWKEEEDDS